MRLPIFFVLLLALSSASVADLVSPSDLVVSRLRIKDAPHANATVVDYLYPGQQKKLIDSNTKYYYGIVLSNGQTGWVAKSHSIIVPEEQIPTGALAITFLYVGQGDSTLIQCPDGNTILIDAGSTSGVSAEKIKQQLEAALGDSRNIDTLIVTHPDADHYNRMPDTLAGYNIERVFRVGTADDYSYLFWDWYTNIDAQEFVLVSEDYDPPHQPNSDIPCGEAEAFVLAADIQHSFSAKNTSSIVLMLRFGSFEAVFTGDATLHTERAIIQRYPPDFLDTDLLKIGHHGSLATSSTQEWVDAISPEIAVVSAGKNGYGHPRREIISRMEPHTFSSQPHPIRSATREGRKYIFDYVDGYQESIYSTRDVGKVIVRSDGNSWSVEHERVD